AWPTDVPRNETWDKAISFGDLAGAMALNVATLPITVGAGAFLVRDGELLVVRKTYGPSKGLWTIPSGYVEPRESVVQTIEREVTEETGIAGRAGPILGVRNRVTETANDTFLIFSMTYVSGEPRPDRVEVSEAAFRPLGELTTPRPARLDFGRRCRGRLSLRAANRDRRGILREEPPRTVYGRLECDIRGAAGDCVEGWPDCPPRASPSDLPPPRKGVRSG